MAKLQLLGRCSLHLLGIPTGKRTPIEVPGTCQRVEGRGEARLIYEDLAESMPQLGLAK
jgi:hypothetical protein